MGVLSGISRFRGRRLPRARARGQPGDGDVAHAGRFLVGLRGRPSASRRAPHVSLVRRRVARAGGEHGAERPGRRAAAVRMPPRHGRHAPARPPAGLRAGAGRTAGSTSDPPSRTWPTACSSSASRTASPTSSSSCSPTSCAFCCGRASSTASRCATARSPRRSTRARR